MKPPFLLVTSLLLLSGYGHLNNSRASGRNFKSKSPHDPFILDPDIFVPPIDILRERGFTPEVHEITTEDGYVIVAWRINNPNVPQKPYPVILQHGNFDLSFTWFLNERATSIGYVLADEGYDVWATNSRGNRYCKKTESTNPNFWDFTFDELAKYDLAANVAYIKKVTNYDKVFYVGHSQGTLMYFAKIAEEPSFQQHFKGFIALAPIFYMIHQKSAVVDYMKNPLIDVWAYLKSIGVYNYLSPPGDFNIAEGYRCYFYYPLAKGQMAAIVGVSRVDHQNMNRFPVLCSHQPGGTSINNMLHIIQLLRTGVVSKFDYGTRELNMKKYGQPNPPTYNLDNFKQWNVPAKLILGERDYLSTEEDVQDLLSHMPPEYFEKETIEDYTHLDLVNAEDINDRLIPSMLEFFEKNSL